MRTWPLAILLVGAAAVAARAEPVRCLVIVLDSQDRPVPDAQVTCGGLAAVRQGVDSTFVASGDVAGTGALIVRVTRPDYLDATLAISRLQPLSVVVYLRQAGEPFVRIGGLERPFVAEPDRLLVTLDEADRATHTRISRAAALAELAPLLERWQLVEVPSRAEPPRPFEHCSAGSTVILAQASGADFRPRRNRALAALRGHPRVRSAGPLVRMNPRPSGEQSVGSEIQLDNLPAASQAALDAFAARNGARWDAARRALVLPATIGLAAVDVFNALADEVPGASGTLAFGAQAICLD